MNTNKNLLLVIGEWLEARQSQQPEPTRNPDRSRWLPTPGTVLFTALVIGCLLLAQYSGALTLFAAPNAQTASTGTIAYQGRLADTSGAPLTDTYNMGFRLYSAATGGAPLWTEEWTGSNGVRVSDGLFNVMLGSLTSIPQAVITGNENLFLGITVGTDDEMAPRVQLGSVPFATQALTVPDGSITAEKLADSVFKVFKTSQSASVWDVPSCDVPDSSTGDHLIPGMTLEFELDKPHTALIDVSGLGQNQQADQAVYSSIVVDGELLRTEGGQAVVGGCRNSPNDSGNKVYCGLANSSTIDLEPGTHKIETWVLCDGDGPVKIHSTSMRALLLPN